MDSTIMFVSGLLFALLLASTPCEPKSVRMTEDPGDKWKATYRPLPGTAVEDHLYENVIYTLANEEGDLLKFIRGPEEMEGKLFVGTSYGADEKNGTSRFLFISKKNDSDPGLAAFVPGDQSSKTGYVRFIGASSNSGKAALTGRTKTAFNPVVCIDQMYHRPCINDSYLQVYPTKADNCTDPPSFYLNFGLDNNTVNHRRLDVDDNDTKDGNNSTYISPINPHKNATQFYIRPVINRAVSVVQSFTFLKSPTEMLSEAKDVKLGISELIINKGQSTYTHEITHEYKTSHEASFETFVTLSSSFSVSVEVSVGVNVPGVASGSVSAGAGFSFESTSTSTSTSTQGASETLTMTQRIIVGPSTQMKCTAFVKVVPHSTIPYVATAKVTVFWDVFDPISNKVIPKPAPLGIALAEVAKNVKGWDIIGSDGDAVEVRFRGSLTAEHGISTIFSSENL